MQNKIAFICPLYDMKNHFELAFTLYKSKKELSVAADLWFVFSNQEQFDKFDNLIFSSLYEHVRGLVLPDNLQSYKSKVVIKKMYALKQLMHNYSYIALVDSETKFLQNVDYSELFKFIWENRLTLNSNISPDGFFILRKCFRTMGLWDNQKLRNEFENYKYNFWFNEIQVYKCDLLPDFFTWLKQFKIESWGNEWLCFEYYIFAAYLIICKEYHINKFPYVSMGGIMEYIAYFSEYKQRKIMDDFQTHWTSNPKVTNDRICLLFHLDRSVEELNYSYANFSLLKMKKMELKRLLLVIYDFYTPQFLKKIFHVVMSH